MLQVESNRAGLQSGPYRPSTMLGGVERVIDTTGERLKEEFLTFLECYREISLGSSRSPLSSELPTFDGMEAPPQLSADLPFYRQKLLNMCEEGTSTMYVDYGHLARYNDVLANAIVANFYRFEPFLRAALHKFVLTHTPIYARLNNSSVAREFWVSIYGIPVSHRYHYYELSFLHV